ncbi:hypothetical protein PN836_003305 [Ningiella sp. W23]|uniref:hypothetical protein n=1 Tax=Ningiella sp. W23 TaxID=3023715 RepID=UPI003756FCD5
MKSSFLKVSMNKNSETMSVLECVKSALLLLTCAFILSGCDGSDSDTNIDSPSPISPNPGQPSPTPPVSTVAPIIEGDLVNLYGQTQAQQGDAVGFALTSKVQEALIIDWTQTAGPATDLLASNSKAIGFDVPDSGEYSFSVNVRTASGSQVENLNVELSVNDAVSSNSPQVSVRLDHSATEQAKVSLHASLPDDKTVSQITWRQISGPEIVNPQSQSDFFFFDAPVVSKDELVQVEVEVSFTDGSQATDDAFISINDTDFDLNGLFYSNGFVITQDMHAYRSNSPYKDAIEQCVYSNVIPSRPNCNFDRLPLLGTEFINPSIDDILDRTLVSHQWMGERFEEYLRNSIAGQDMQRLLRAVTAVVISYDVRPSFYWAATGAIYLDANNFWRSPQERDTLNDQPDFRSDFGNELGFSVFWRYTKNNDYYPSGRYEKSQRESRSFSDLEASISWLMYHELAHANDFFPPSAWQNIRGDSTPLSFFQSNGANSDILDTRYPLRSSQMHALAGVSFGGQAATEQQKNYDGTDIESFFAPDRAPSYYAYFTIREDFATLAERFFMLHRLGAQADVAIIDGESAQDFTVTWGQRNRISDPKLTQRAAFAVERVYPELGDVSALQTALPAPVSMTPGSGWFENIDISPVSAPQTTDPSLPSLDENPFAVKKRRLEQAAKDQRRPHDGRPELKQ